MFKLINSKPEALRQPYQIKILLKIFCFEKKICNFVVQSEESRKTAVGSGLRGKPEGKLSGCGAVG